MFAKGSRYRRLDQSSTVDARGEYLLGTELRLIPDTPAQFQHTVRDRDRLDLMAYKYYSDASRWWQICDANPQFAFPNDLLDRAPLVDVTLVLVYPDAEFRFTALLTALAAIGRVTAPVAGLPGDFVACAVIVEYPAAASRAQILNQVAANGFHLLRSFAWSEAAGIAEQFTIEDIAVKTGWQDLMRTLLQTTGIHRAVGDMSTSSLYLTFNSAVLSFAGIRGNIAQYGFDTPATLAQTWERIGRRVLIPPNGVA